MDTIHSPFNLFQPIAIGSDHAGFEYKEEIKQYLESKGLPIKDFGAHSKDAVDYPDIAHPVSSAVENGDCGFGILFCGSANGVAITANKHHGIRAAICWDSPIAELARKHNDANIICIPARYVSMEIVIQMVDTFMSTEFEGGRHTNRVNKIKGS
ncbi:MAG: ribose 5-phosphate isomerase B [Chitinophagaceae bacterium]